MTATGTRPPLRAMFFDLDGTLVDTAVDFWHILNAMRADHDLPVIPLEVVRGSVSDGARGMLHAAFRVAPEDPGYELLKDEFLRRYAEDPAAHGRPFPGIDSVLAWLEERAMPWGVVTNKASDYTLPLLDALHLLDRTAAVICPDHVDRGKPDPESLHLACRQAGVDAAASAYVGDHARDIEAGRRAGMRTVGATYGYVPADEDPENWQADHYVDAASGILDWLRDLERSTE